ncbi:unnamed protein product [Effrenium voratum]|nr:unnamed protein product [Effrenium voratum]
MAACARLLLCRTNVSTLGAQTPRAPTEEAGESGVMSKPSLCRLARVSLGAIAASVVDYDALRSSAAAGAVAAAEKVKSYVVKFGKAQRAVEQALDMYHRRCASK